MKTMTAYYRSKGTPFFKIIYENLKHDIECGDYLPGARLPSESELCHAYGVQRDTVRRALQRLVDEGIIFKRPGRGSFVSEGERVTITIDRAHLNNPVIAHLLMVNGVLDSKAANNK